MIGNKWKPILTFVQYIYMWERVYMCVCVYIHICAYTYIYIGYYVLSCGDRLVYGDL